MQKLIHAHFAHTSWQTGKQLNLKQWYRAIKKSSHREHPTLKGKGQGNKNVLCHAHSHPPHQTSELLQL
jgi:hypothetical protein